MNDSTAKLRSLTKVILSEEHPGKLRAACFDLYDFFCEIAGFSDPASDDDLKNGSYLASGKAISPLNAARCLWDFKRTTEFLRGVAAAIRELQNRFPHEKIEVLYAGCGPFGSLLVPLLDRLPADRMNLTLLDYHRASIVSVAGIFEKLSSGRFFADFIQTDAARYTHPRRPHLVICEAMQTALANETQTAISSNLAPQLCENGIFIPQRVAVELCLANPGKEMTERERIHLGKVFEVDAENIKRDDGLEFSPVSFRIPTAAKNRNLDFALLTKILIFDHFGLDDYDSAITYPKFLRLKSEIGDLKTIEISYIADGKPRFEYKRIAS